jgi:glycosyltransferase involved in cell wall biosynthesis
VTGTPQWHFLTPEYPPDPGGVADYTRLVARALSARGEIVHVWAPSVRRDDLEDEGILVHRFEGFGARGLRQLEAGLSSVKGERRLFVQYVPTALGLRGMNVPLIRWLAATPDEVWVQFHEVALGWQLWRKPQHHLMHAVQIWMASKLARRADRIFASIEGWLPRLGSEARRAVWLPIPSNVPTDVPASIVCATRRELGGGPWVGHFGTYGPGIIRDLGPALRLVAGGAPHASLLLLGRGATAFAASLGLGTRVRAEEGLSPEALATRLAACDLLMQPFPDGISTRRTSAMAGLALGVPIVTSDGHLTDSVWRTSGAVSLAPVGSAAELGRLCLQLLQDAEKREALGQRGKALYAERFSLERTRAVLLGTNDA